MHTVPRNLGLLIFVLFALAGLVASASAGDHGPWAIDGNRVAIKGYDTVAYFTDGKAIQGSASNEVLRDDVKWWFASAGHRDMFIADPDHYAPRFGGFCAGAMTSGVLVPANPEQWVIVDGKLYMEAGSIKDWKADAAENIQRANKHWPEVRARLAAQSQ